MTDFTDHTEVKALFTEAQEVEEDNRNDSREAHQFINDKNGQWEPNITTDINEPRYTFDMTTSVVEAIAGEMDEAEFSVRVKPKGGDTTKDDAKLRDGLIRNIEDISGAVDIYGAAGRNMVTGGIAGWRIEHKFVDGDSFDQDLVITPIIDFTNRVWFDPNAKEQDKSDSNYCFVINPVSKDEADEAFPDRGGQFMSVDQNKSIRQIDETHKPDDIMIGQIYYRKKQTRVLVLMSDGSVHEETDEFKSVVDELKEKDIIEVRRRKRDTHVIMSRLFDGTDWLIKEEETVFRHWIPVIPTYGNYRIDCNKTLYRGVVEKLMDPQRVLNYSLSREIAEGALAPRKKYWMTSKQAAGHENTLRTMNTNHDPLQFYTPDPDAVGPPVQTGGAEINPGLRVISESMRGIIGQSAGVFAASMGDNPGLQSGVAIEKLQNKGDTGTITYFKSQEIAIRHTGRILIDAMPRVYDTERQVRIMNEDGTFDMAFVNQTEIDNETGKPVTLNDLSKGQYDVTATAGPSFQNRQQEAVSGLVEMAAIDPTIMPLINDIIMNNLTVPGADLAAERLRAQKLDAGGIPVDQMTDEEKQAMLQQLEQQAQQNQQPTPEQMIGQAELIKAQNEQAKTQISVQEKGADIQLKATKTQADIAKDQEQLKLAIFKARTGAANDKAQTDLNAQGQQFDQFMVVQQQQTDQLVAMADTLKTIQEAAAGPVAGPGLLQNVKEQSDLLTESQQEILNS